MGETSDRDGTDVRSVLESVLESALGLAGSGPGPDEDFAALFEHAADVFNRRGESASAVATFARAASLSAASPERARRLGKAAYVSAALVGDLRAAESLLAGVSRATGPGIAPAPETALADSTALMHGDGDADAAFRMLTAAVEIVDPARADPAAIENTLQALLLICHYSGRSDLWAAFHTYVGRTGQARFEKWETRGRLNSDPVRFTVQALEELDADINALGTNADLGEVLRIAGAALFVDRLPGCRRALRRASRRGAESGTATMVLYADSMLALEAYSTSQWLEAGTRATAARDLAAERGYRMLELVSTTTLAALAADRGDLKTARELADEVCGWAAPRGAARLVGFARYVYTRIAIAEGDFEAAYSEATSISPAGRLDPHQAYALWVCLDLVEAAVHTNRPEKARAHVRALREARISQISPRLRMLFLAASALAGPDDAAKPLFEHALAEPGTEPWPFDVARVHLLYGERLRRTREASQARTHLNRALDVFQRLNAAPWTARAASELRATGQVRMRRDIGTHEALTPQELEIAMLAATGLSNKQIGTRLMLSHRTVGAHLYRAFPKLGISTRAALRDALAPD